MILNIDSKKAGLYHQSSAMVSTSEKWFAEPILVIGNRNFLNIRRFGVIWRYLLAIADCFHLDHGVAKSLSNTG